MNHSLVRLLGTSLVIAAVFVAAQAQTRLVDCNAGKERPEFGFWTWPEKALVKVFVISADFKDEERSYLWAPFERWNAAARLTNSGVEFQYVGEVHVRQNCDNCLTIRRGRVFDETRRHATELHAFSARSDRLITHAAIVIDSRLTKVNTLTNAIAHEVGHTFGLPDCHACPAKSTVMLQFTEVNVSNQMEGPTESDIVRVEQYYKELRRILACSSVAIDEGEEPIDDDTPIVNPER